MFRARGVNPGGAEEQVKVLVEPLGHWVKAAGAGHLKITLVSGTQADVVDQLVRAAMLGQQVCTAGNRESAHLLYAGTVIDSARRDSFAEINRLPFEIGHSNKQRHGILTDLRVGRTIRVRP